jgi:hypothetical protein
MRKTRNLAGFATWLAVIMMLTVACDDELDIRQDYRFDLETMPVQKRIRKNETVEIRCQLVKEGNYRDAKYTIRYFQTDGKGELYLDDGRLLTPNDLFLLGKDVFKLYYTSHCTDQQNFDVFIEDSFGQVVQKTFNFQNQHVEPEPEIDLSFEFESLPVPKSVLEGETVEIRCLIKRIDSRNDTDYYIRYFQPDGKGELRLDDGTALVPNDLYLLENDVFRLYYTSRCAVLQTIDIYIRDSAGKIVKKTFGFAGVPADETENETTEEEAEETE